MKPKNKSKKSFCPKPFEFLAVQSDGSAWVCCEDWLPISIGNLSGNEKLEDVWNSDKAKSIRRSILEGTFEYCHHTRCPFIVSNTLPDIDEKRALELLKFANYNSTIRAPLPQKLSLAYDPTCNLKCPFCRSDYIVLSKEGRSNAQQIQEKLFSTSSQSLKEITLIGYGDPFSSTVFVEFLKTVDPGEYPFLTINLITNGLLLTSRMWDSVSAAHGLIGNIHVSIDACSVETYKQNRGGKFQVLLKNLKFIASLRKQKAISRFEIGFVVQNNNFEEMPDFVWLGKKLDCDEVLFQKIFNWGTYEEEDFKEIAVHEPIHKRHQDFVNVLNSEILEDKIVNLSNLSNLKIV